MEWGHLEDRHRWEGNIKMDLIARHELDGPGSR
jgi:hypothetical protein